MLRITVAFGMTFMALACSNEAAAQVYKCKGASGEAVYSQRPCGAQAEEMKVRSSKAASSTAGEAATRAAVYRSTDLSDAAIAERNCLASSSSSIYQPVNSRIAGYQRQIGELNAAAARAKNNLAGATYEAGIRTQLAGLQQTIATERQAADASMNLARQRCANDRRERQSAIEKKYQVENP
ncbi:MAG: DUF4124 domain-containing protein [Pseudomonas sp.]|uniref:DUF4124 domain-containing protein n=1 Tax=Stenotrophomonas sp. TaxID=69392 RepID=UPI003D6D7ACC